MRNRTDFIPFSKPSIGKQEEQAAIDVLRSGWLTTGKVCAEFENEFAAYVGTKHALAVNSGTAGLHLALEALEIKPKQLVLTTPYTFAASVEIIEYLGARPLFVDIEEDSYNIDPNRVEPALKRYKHRIGCVLPVHIGGLPCNMSALCALAGAQAIPLVEDAAHAFPVKLNNKFLGTFGSLGVFSFYANKTITTGEGGMIVTDNDALAAKIKVCRLHGIDRDVWNRYTDRADTRSWYYQIVEKGYKYNLPDLLAAIGRVQLSKARDFLAKRTAIAQCYLQELADCDFISLPGSTEAHAWHLFMIKIQPAKLTINRDEFIEKLREQGIGVSVHFIPLHIMPYFKTKYGFKPRDFPLALNNYLRSISLPVYPGLSRVQTKRVIESIKKIGYAHYKTNGTS
jgi:dTDP-4-amino-4,6-dideoxygalactose transaminase